MGPSWFACFLAGWLAELAAFIFLGLAWKTRGKAVLPMIFLKPGYFIFHPIFHPTDLTLTGRRYRLLAFACFGIAGAAYFSLRFALAPSLTHHPS
jgi:hypothetical protein